MPGPDFPTGGEILGRAGARMALMTGRGSVVIRAKHHTETIRGREAIVFTEIPYQVNKAEMVERIGEQVREKRIEGIAEVRDESNRLGIRLVVELKRDAVADVVLNQLYRFSQLQTSFGVNMLALNNGRPEQMGLRADADARSWPSASRWSRGAPSSAWRRRASAATKPWASPSPSPISTK